MSTITRLETGITYLILAFAAVMGFSRGGINTVIWLLFLVATIRYCWRPFPLEAAKEIKWPMIIFFAALGLSTLFSSNILASLKFLGMSFIRILPFFVVAAFVSDRKASERAVTLMAVSMIIGSAVAIWQGLHGAVRVQAMLGKMDLAGIIGLLVPLLLVNGLAGKTDKRLRLLFIVAAVAAIVALLFNGTRGVWVSLGLTCTIYAIINFVVYGRRHLKVTLVLFFVLIAAGLLVVTNENFAARFLSIFSNMRSNQERLEMWAYAWEVFKSHPIFGVGLATLPNFSYTAWELIQQHIHPTYGHVHNNFFQMMAENGVVGLTAWFFLFISILKTAFRKLKSPVVSDWAMIAFLCTIEFLLHGMFDYTFTISTIMYSYWFILGLAYANFAGEGQSNGSGVK